MAKDCTYRFTDRDGKERVIQGQAAFKAYLASGGLEHLLPSAPVAFSSKQKPEFYSQLSRVIGGVPDRLATMPAQQWKAWIESNSAKLGVKKDEIEWSGIKDYLDLRGKDKVTRADLVDYLDQNGVRVTETVLGSGGLNAAEKAELDDLNRRYQDYEREVSGAVFDAGDFDRLQELEQNGERKGLAQYGQYTLPGGENYRELLLTLPSKQTAFTPYEEWWKAQMDAGKKASITNYRKAREAFEAKQPAAYQSSHWDEKNVLAHIRLNNRTDADDKRVLFVEEVQSDWGQQGKKSGFANAALRAELEKEIRALGIKKSLMNISIRDLKEFGADADLQDRFREEMLTGSMKVLPAPFIGKTEGWLNLALKRITMMAVEGGYDKVAFVNGDQSAERYDLSKHVSRIEYEPTGDGKYEIVAIDKSDNRVIDEAGVDISRVEELIGKDLASKIAGNEGRLQQPGKWVVFDGNEKLFESESERDAREYASVADGKPEVRQISGWDNDRRVLSGLDLKVGGEGMKTFYDQIVPQNLNKLLPKIGGAKMGTVEMVTDTGRYKGPVSGEDVMDALGIRANRQYNYWANLNQAERDKLVEDYRQGEVTAMTQPGFDVTDSMRETVGQGLPMFSRAQDLTPEQVLKPETIAAAEAAIAKYKKAEPPSRAEQKNAAASRVEGTSAERFKRTPELQQAVADLQAGNITRDEYNRMVDESRPVYPYAAVPDVTTPKDARYALANGRGQSAEKAAKYGVPTMTLIKGDWAQLRLDIPSYQEHDTWVVSVHTPKSTNREVQTAYDAGPVVGYESVAALTDVTFGMNQKMAARIATGTAKGTIATMLGKWSPISKADAKARADAALNDPAWTQVGMDPFRHSYFYDRDTMRPVLAADEVIQIGPLVLAKNVTFGQEADITGAPIAFAKRQPVGKETEGWLLSRDELGRFRFGAGAKAYRYAADVANSVLDVVGMKPVSPELSRAMRKMRVEIDKAQNLTVEVAKSMKDLPDQERQMISDVIEGELKRGAKPPKRVLEIAASMQDIMSEQSAELVRLGMLTPGAAGRWDGKYLPRFYEQKLGDETKAWMKAVKGLLGRKQTMQGIKGSSLKARGMFETVPVADLADWEAEGWEVRDDAFDPAVDDQITVWRDYTRAERDDMGEIRDAMFRFVMGYNKSQRDIALGRLYENLAATYAKPGKGPVPEGYVEVPKTNVEDTFVKRYGKLAGKYVPSEILDQLTAFDSDMQNDLTKIYLKGLSMWKEGKTVLNPVAHANNVLSNVTMAHFAGVSYWDAHKYIGSIKDLVKGDAMVEEAKEAGLFGGTFNRSELTDAMPEELKVLAQMAESKGKRAVEMVWNGLSLWLRKPLGKAYNAEDEFFRYVVYRDARNNGLSVDDSVDYALKYMFSYDDMPKGARVIRDMPVGLPFFSYTYKIVPALVNTALEHPARYAAPAVALYVANAAMYAIAASLGGGDDEDWWTIIRRYMTDPEFRQQSKDLEEQERKNLPPWMKGASLSLGTEKAIRLGMDDLTNLPVFLDVSRIFPGGDLFDAHNNAGGIPLLAPITPNSPILTIASAMLFNKDTFRGQDIVKKTDTDAEAAQKRAAWMWKQITPAIAVGNSHFERAMNVIANVTGQPVNVGLAEYTGIGKDGLPITPGYAALQTVGIKARPIDLDTSEKIQKAQTKALIRELEMQIKQSQRLENKGAISPTTGEAEREKLREKKQFIRQGLTVEGEEKD